MISVYRYSLSCHISFIVRQRGAKRPMNASRNEAVSPHSLNIMRYPVVIANKPSDKSQKPMETHPIVHHGIGHWKCNNNHVANIAPPVSTMLSKVLNSQ